MVDLRTNFGFETAGLILRSFSILSYYSDPFPLMNDSSPHEGYPLRPVGRVLLAFWCLLLISGFVAAACLTPNPQGFGTHQQLRLPPCSFQPIFGLPCPSCGMTTSFSHFIRGQWLLAVRANVTGTLLAFLCAVQIPWCLISVWNRRLWRVSYPVRLVTVVLLVVYTVAAIYWSLRL